MATRGAAGGGVVPRRARAGVSVPPAPPAPLGRASRLGAVSREAVSLSHAAAVRALSMRPLPLDAPGEAFLVYQPRGGLAEQALALRSAIAAARALRRTLVLPHLRLPAADVPAPGLGSSTSGGRQRQADAAAPASGPSGSQLWSEVPFGAVFDVEAVRVAAGGRVVTLGDYLVAGGGAPERVMLVAGDTSGDLGYFAESLGWGHLKGRGVPGGAREQNSVDIVKLYGPAQDTLLALSSAVHLFGDFAREQENRAFQAQWLRALQPAEGLRGAIDAAMAALKQSDTVSVGLSLEGEDGATRQCGADGGGGGTHADQKQQVRVRAALKQGFLCRPEPGMAAEAVQAAAATSGSGERSEQGVGVYLALDSGVSAPAIEGALRGAEVGKLLRASDFDALLPAPLPALRPALDLFVLARTACFAGGRFSALATLVADLREAASDEHVMAAQFWKGESTSAEQAHFSQPRLHEDRLTALSGKDVADRGSAKQASWLTDLLEDADKEKSSRGKAASADAKGAAPMVADVSVITACMNRNDMLVRVLPTWLEVEGVAEVIVVDWSSGDRVRDALEESFGEALDPRVRVVSVQGMEHWVLSHAINLAAEVATSARLLKVDCDTEVRPGLVARHPDAEQAFYTGSWEQARTENELHLNGIMLVRRADFWAVNGFNEHMVTYGYDDTDLYLRLERRGMVHDTIRLELAVHLQHGNARRQKRAEEAELPVKARIHLNRLMLMKQPQWSKGDRRVTWACELVDASETACAAQSRPQSLEKLTPPGDLEKYKRAAMLSWQQSLDKKLSSGGVASLVGLAPRKLEALPEAAKEAMLELARAVRTSPAPLLVVHVWGSLTMRLRQLARGVALAAQSNRRAALVWKADPSQCACSFANVFAAESAVLAHELPHDVFDGGRVVRCVADDSEHGGAPLICDGISEPDIKAVLASDEHVYLKLTGTAPILPQRGSALGDSLAAAIEALDPNPPSRAALRALLERWDVAAGDALCAPNTGI